MQQRRGICWSHATTVGNIAVASNLLRGEFDNAIGARALIACEFSPAGKYRNGAPRWWCRTHQTYWGVKADLARFDAGHAKACSAAQTPLDFVLDPLVIDMERVESARIEADGFGALLVRANHSSPSGAIDARVAAVAITGIAGVFANADIVQVHVTPPALQALALARSERRQLGCLDCARCRYPHLDLGAFAHQEHRRHYCGNCGNDSTHSKTAIVSNPLFTLGEHFGERLTFDIASQQMPIIPA